ncbi:hypothetical protein M3Y94_01055600 [Aphelenchoides besseyi]|nr:hypothetical protein M3Y94_01055600 [Aphelenchoides besseyi]KAI6224134.1 hypothetical protein M3Y95_00851100 [Aphelenchoides besseyi]
MSNGACKSIGLGSVPTNLVNVPKQGIWRMFNRGNAGRFVYAFNRDVKNNKNRLMVVDLWNENHIILNDMTPNDAEEPIPENRIFDIYALTHDCVLILWQESKSMELILSKVQLNFKTSSMVMNHNLLGPVNQHLNNDVQQDFILPVEDLNGCGVLIRIPYNRTCLLYDLNLNEAVRQLEIHGEDLSENFRIHQHRDADGAIWLYVYDEAYVNHIQHNLPTPTVYRTCLRLPNQPIPSNTEFVFEDHTVQKIPDFNKPQIDHRLFKRVTTTFDGEYAYVLYRAVAFVVRKNCAPNYYRLFKIFLPNCSWSELVFAPNFFAKYPMEMPHTHECMNLTDGILELNLVFGTKMPTCGHRISIPIRNLFQEGAIGAMIGYRIPIMASETLGMLSYFNLPDKTNSKIPKNFVGRSMFAPFL